MESCQTHRDGKATAAARREAARAHCRRATCRAAQSTTRAVILSCSVRLLYFRLLSKWWVYPGWTWRGYIADLKTVAGLIAFAIGVILWLFKAYRLKDAD